MLPDTETLHGIIERLELLDVTFNANDGWLTDERASLYRAALTALIESAQSEGFSLQFITDDSKRITVDVTIEPERDYETDECEYCEGSGTDPQSMDGDDCPRCGGFGNIIVDTCDCGGSIRHTPDEHGYTFARCDSCGERFEDTPHTR